MRPLALRRLTGGERELAQEVFGAGLDGARLRLLALPLWSRAFVAGPRLMVWPRQLAFHDFATAPLWLQSVFVHELTHAWQAQGGTNLLIAKLRCGDSEGAYAYNLEAGPPFSALNIEQQAMVVQHAFLVSRGGVAQHPPEVYAAVSAAWRGG